MAGMPKAGMPKVGHIANFRKVRTALSQVARSQHSTADAAAGHELRASGPKFRGRLLGLSVLAILALFAGACGSSEERTSSTADFTQAAAPAPSLSPTPTTASEPPAPPAPTSAEPPLSALPSSTPISAATAATASIEPIEPLPSTAPELAQLSIDAGSRHNCLVHGDGSVSCWGMNDNGQLGNGESGMAVYSDSPVKVVGIDDAVSVAAGWEHTCALHRSGEVSCWGDNNRGELGDGQKESTSPTPVRVVGIDDAVAVSAGDWHTCALRSGGSISCWGYNADGQLGNGEIGEDADSPVPVGVVGIDNASAISLGGEHSCALSGDGTVSCWGDNWFGEIGQERYGADSDAPLPMVVVGLTDVVAIDTAVEHSCAAHESGKVSCWGSNSVGQLGANAMGGIVPTPQQIQGIDDAVDVSVGTAFSCAVLTDGSVSCWGSNWQGTLGIGEEASVGTAAFLSITPLKVAGLADVVDISSGTSHTCALTKSSAVYCWGSNFNGELGAGWRNAVVSGPVKAMGIADATSVSAGVEHSCAVHSDGKVSCWGSNWRGARGEAEAMTQASPAAPVEISGISNAVDVVATLGMSCALVEVADAENSVLCWGLYLDNDFESTDGGVSPLPVPLGQGGVVKFAGGAGHVCFLHSDGLVSCAGANRDGVLGAGAPPFSLSRVVVDGISGAVDISSGNSHACVLIEGGEAFCWGRNFYGQLGSGDEGPESNKSEPVKVVGIDDASMIAAGGENTCAVHESGEFSCWGISTMGELGLGAPTGSDHSSLPVLNSEIEIGTGDTAALSVGVNFLCALNSDGEVYCWGYNFVGQLGSMSLLADDHSRVPLKVDGIDDAIFISAGGVHTCVVHSDGSVSCWGWSKEGQLGTGSTVAKASSYGPVAVVGLGLADDRATG